MAIDFNKLTADQATKLIALSSDPQFALEVAQSVSSELAIKTAAEVRKYISGDHWQDGKGWIGPMPVDETGQRDETAFALIEEHFVSRNMLADIIERHVYGVLGREPSWNYTVLRALPDDEQPNESEQKQIDAVQADLTAWWDKRHCHEMLQRAGGEELLSSRAVLRIFVPSSRLVELVAAQPARSAKPRLVSDNTPAPSTAAAPADAAAGGSTMGVVGGTLTEALDHIYVEVVSADDANVYTDPDSMDKVGVVRYSVPTDDDPTVIAMTTVVELTYLDGDASVPQHDRETVIRNAGEPKQVKLKLGGRLLHYAMSRPPLVTPQLVSQQRSLNLATSMLPRNVETSGFTERTLLNAQLPGHWDEDAEGNRTFVPEPYITGSGTINNVLGAPVENAVTGGETLMTPDIRYKEPSPVSPTVDAINAIVSEMLREAKQGHVLGTDQAQSGISRVQARADFEKSLGRTVSSIEPAGRWLLETVLALASVFAQELGDAAGASEALRAEFNCFTDTGPLDPSEQTAILDAVTKGFLSLETGMQVLNVEDTTAEVARLNAEPGHRVDLRAKLLANTKAGVDLGLTPGVAAKLAGWEKDEVKLIEEDTANNPPAGAVMPGSMQQALNPDGSPKVDAAGNPVMEPVPAQPGQPAVPGAPVPQKGVVPPQLAAHAAAAAAGAGGVAAA